MFRRLLILLVAAVALLTAVECAKGQAQKSGNRELVETFSVGESSWTAHRDGKNGRVYYYNRITGTSQWEDPRKDPSADRAMALGLMMLPFGVMLLAGAAYIIYMKMHHPEKLKLLLQGPPKKKGRAVDMYLKESKEKSKNKNTARSSSSVPAPDAASSKSD